MKRLVTTFAGGLVAVAVAVSITSAHHHPAVAASHALERQQSLPPAAIRALQDLRLAAAVELAYFTSRGRYATADQLKSAGYLDPRWPRSDPSSYRVFCLPEQEHLGFVCYADPASPGLPYFRIDATQIVRQAPHQRPAADGATFE